MSLVDDLITEVVDSASDLGQVLRKARVLASDLGSEELRLWVESEQNGYPKEDTLPSYRVSVAINRGNFIGTSWRGESNIPLNILPENYRDIYSKLELRGGVAALLEMHQSDGYRWEWSADLVASVSNKVFDNMSMISAWKVIPPARVVETLDAIRNRLLNFLLDLKEQYPVVAADGDLKSIPEDEIRASVINHFYGDHTTVNQQIHQGVQAGEILSLLAALRELSISEDLINDLSPAITEDESGVYLGIGPKVFGWLARVSENAATSSAAGIATQAILRFYGISPDNP